MKKTTLTEDARLDFQDFFDAEDFSANQMTSSKDAALRQNAPSENNSFLDTFLTAVKWIFLYFPGVAAIHFIMMGVALLFLYNDWGIEMMLGTLGVFAVSVFMIMFGIGKLRDLEYLKVVLGVFLTSSLCAVLYAILAVFIPGDFFGFFAKITLPLPMVVGYLVKRKIDGESEN